MALTRSQLSRALRLIADGKTVWHAAAAVGTSGDTLQAAIDSPDPYALVVPEHMRARNGITGARTTCYTHRAQRPHEVPSIVEFYRLTLIETLNDNDGTTVAVRREDGRWLAEYVGEAWRHIEDVRVIAVNAALLELDRMAGDKARKVMPDSPRWRNIDLSRRPRNWTEVRPRGRPGGRFG